MYKRIASISGPDELGELQEEMIDRYGILPESVHNLFKAAKLKLKAGPLGIRKIELGETGGRIHFSENANIDVSVLLQLIQSQPGLYQLDGKDRLRISQTMPDIDGRFRVINDLLESLSLKDAA